MKNSQITSEQKKESIQKLLNSSDIRSNDKYSKLIQYLFDATIDNRQIKESTIAIECFGNDSNYDPSIDSYVRVYLSKLRKKIEHYYLTDGIEDKIQISIPKGNYSLDFVEFEQKSFKYKFSLKFLAKIIPLLIIVSGISYFFGTLQNNKVKSSLPSNDIIWQNVLTSKKTTLIVMGDYYFFSYPFSSDRKSYIRDVEINSDTDLKNFVSNNPKLKDDIKIIYHTYLDEHIPLCISSILPSFISSEINYEFRLASEVQLNDFNNYNIVYIGSYKSLNLLSNIVGKLNFKYQVYQPASSLIFKDILTNESFSYKWVTNVDTKARNDFAMVIKVKGPNNNTFMFFLSEHDFGNLSTSKYFTNRIKIQEFENKLKSEYFEALFEVKGIERTDLSMDLLHINQLDNNFTMDLESTIK